MKRNLLAAVAALCLISAPVWADEYGLATKAKSEFPTIGSSSIDSEADEYPVWDDSAQEWKMTSAGYLAGSDATAAEIDRVSDLSERPIYLDDGTEAITLTAHSDRIMYTSNCQGTQAITLPDGGSVTGGKYKFVLNCEGTNALTIAVPSGDNTSMRGFVTGAQSDGTTFFSSAAVAGGSDTITLTSVSQGSWVVLDFSSASTIYVDGRALLSQGSGATLFSSAVTSTD